MIWSSRVSSSTYCLLLIVRELSSLVLELDRTLPLWEVLGLLNAVSFSNGTLSKFAEAAHSRLKHVQLATECLQERLNLVRDYVLRHLWAVVETYFNNSFSLAKCADKYWIVHNVRELFIGDGANLVWIQSASLMIGTYWDLLSCKLRHLASFCVADVSLVAIAGSKSLHLISGAGKL